MPRPLVLAAVFLASLLFWLLWNFPAAPLVARADGVPLAGEPLRLTAVRGMLRQGGVEWRWQEQSGRVDWSLRWKGLRPGVQLRAHSGGAELAGWFTGTSDSVRARDLDLAVPLSLVSDQIEQGGADGTLEGRIGRFSWKQGGVPRVEGNLRYNGGRVTWPDGRAEVPPLDGELYNEEEAAWLVVRSPEGTRLMDGQMTAGTAEFRLYRAWPILLGVSEGGDPGDVIFQVNEAFGPS